MYIEDYHQQGIHIDTFVPQNEPGFEPNGYDDVCNDNCNADYYDDNCKGMFTYYVIREKMTIVV